MRSTSFPGTSAVTAVRRVTRSWLMSRVVDSVRASVSPSPPTTTRWWCRNNASPASSTSVSAFACPTSYWAAEPRLIFHVCWVIVS